MPKQRKTIRLGTENYRGRRIYFATLCCAERHPVFLDETAGRQLLDQLVACATMHAFSLHAFCLMPDHLHILVEGMDDACDFTRFVAAFKQQSAYAYSNRTGLRLWQSRYYDHILRKAKEFESVAWYIWANPVRKGLCTAPQEYPLSGSLTTNWKNHCAPVHLWSPPWKTERPGLKPGATQSL